MLAAMCSHHNPLLLAALKALPSPSPSPSPITAPIVDVSTCGDTRPDLAGNQPFDCKSLGDFVPSENATNIGPANGSVCCRPRYGCRNVDPASCLDVDPAMPGCQPFYCDESSGWFRNQAAYYRPNPSAEVCCLVSWWLHTQLTTARCVCALVIRRNVTCHPVVHHTSVTWAVKFGVRAAVLPLLSMRRHC